jgi:hypothetical protein
MTRRIVTGSLLVLEDLVYHVDSRELSCSCLDGNLRFLYLWEQSRVGFERVVGGVIDVCSLILCGCGDVSKFIILSWSLAKCYLRPETLN